MISSNDLATVEILFDNGGSVTLQTDGYAHLYDDPARADADYKLLAAGADTADWDGNDRDAEVTNYDHYRFFDHAEIQAIVANGAHETSWRNEREFFAALGVDSGD